MKYISKFKFDGIEELLHLRDSQSAHIVTPEEFGAKGDGVTDDTEALQDMFNNVHCGNIVFNSKLGYVISAPLTIKSTNATLSVFLSFIKYVGSANIEGAMINIIRDSEQVETYGHGGVILYGGCLDCGNMEGDAMGSGIRVDAFNVTLNSIQIRNYRAYGIDIAHSYTDTTPISSQAIVSDCYINNFPYAQIGTAIRCVHSDNRIDNCIANRCNVAVELIHGGNYFSNCHFTISSVAITSASDNVYSFIKNNPVGAGEIATNLFSNCYFNGWRMKYLIEDVIDHNYMTKLDNCNLILGHTDIENYAHLTNANESPIQIDNLGVRKSTVQTIYGLYPFTGATRSIFRDNMTVDCQASKTNNSFDIVNLDERPVPFITSNNPLPAKRMRRIASFKYISPAPTSAVINAAISGRQLIELAIGNQAMKLNYKAGDALVSLKFYIDSEPKEIVIDGVTYKYLDVYAYNNNNETAIENYCTAFCNNETFPFSQIFIYYNNTDFTPDLSRYTEIVE